ncbi:MAG TPA: RagB/SusD family nutrient uptake outer membrane protein [Chitinophagaceae bacterium]|jgi:hypothetical protein|nr:RagB/SusD family nutrient uptake outer membrane protein [Chitinophagaceae bacterium]
MKTINQKIWQLGTVMLLIATLLGCKKFLDRKPLEGVLDDYGLEQQVQGLYYTLRDYAGFNSLPWLDFHSIRDDDAQKGSSISDGQEINAEFETFQYTKDDWATNTYWNDHFYLIHTCNSILDLAATLSANDELTIRNIAETKFFRAYSYFELVRAYGEVPLFEHYPATGKEAVKAKSPVADIYALIEKDLKEAAGVLPLTWATSSGNDFPGRLTSGAAHTLLAQVYIWQQKWSQALTECNTVINSGQYQLLPNFQDIWKDGLGGAGKNSKESIFEIQCWTGANGSPYYGSFWGTSQNVRQGGATNEWNLGWGWNTPTDKLESQWSNTDPRKRKTILYSGQSDGGPAEGGYGATLPPYPTLDQKYWNKKVYSDPAMRQFTGEIAANGGASWISHRVLRYADVILMKAEAANETGDGATAAAMLELIRARARGGNNAVLPFVAFASKDQMRAAIKSDRRWEFAMEGYRFYDLVRWNDASAELGSLGYTNRCRYYPIPQKAIDLSGGVLAQNSEW